MRKYIVKISVLVSLLMLSSGCAAYDASIYGTAGNAVSTNIDWALTNEGIKLYNEGKKQEALEKFNQSLAKWPNVWNTLSWRASTYIELGMYDKGLQDLDLCFKLEPASQHTVTYNWYGNAYAGKGDLDKALESFKIALDYKKSSLNYYRYAKVSYEKGLYDQATTEYTNALNHPDTADMNRIFGSGWKAQCYSGRGKAYYKKGMQDEARQDAEKMIELYPRYQNAFGNDPLLYYDTDKRKAITDEARAAAVRAENSGNMLEAFNQLDKAYNWSPYADEKEDAEIIDDMYRVYPKLSLKPNLPEQARRFLVQAQTLAENKNYDGALDANNNAVAVTPWYPEIWFNGAMLRAEKKEYSKAISNMKNYLRLAPDAHDARAAQDYIYKWEVLMTQK